MKSEFARDLAGENETIDQAMAERPGKSIRIRIQPMILRGTGNYSSWKDVRWSLDLDDATEAHQVREAMRVFFHGLTTAGPDAVTAALARLEKPARGGKEKVA